MPATVNRVELLQKLEGAQVALAPRNILAQSTCYIFKGGNVWTYDGKKAVSCPTGLPDDIEGAVQPTQLLDQLRKWEEEEIGVSTTESEFVLTGSTEAAGITMQSTIQLPVDKIERPEEWRKLPDDFNDAISLVHECASVNGTSPILTCVHLHPDWVEAADNKQLARYKVKTGLQSPVLIERDALQHVPKLGMTEVAETPNWFHFRNPTGLVLSCVRYVESMSYHDLGDKLKIRNGVPVSFPKALESAIGKAKTFTDQADNDNVLVEMRPGKLRLTGRSADGYYVKKADLAGYTGEPMDFNVSPTLLEKVVKNHTSCTIGESLEGKRRLVVTGSTWRWLVCLRRTQKNGDK